VRLRPVGERRRDVRNARLSLTAAEKEAEYAKRSQRNREPRWAGQ